MSTANFAANETPMFPTVSMPRYFALCVVTLGLYHFFWVYRAWRIVAQRRGERLNPLARTLLSIFYLRRLFAAIEEATVEAGLPPFNGPAIATAYLLSPFLLRAAPLLGS